MEDHNTRIIVFGSNAGDARAVADAIASEAFHNVSFVAEPVEQVQIRDLPYIRVVGVGAQAQRGLLSEAP